jgi:hypothetical protein
LLFAWYHSALLESVLLRGLLIWTIFGLLWLIKLFFIWIVIPVVVFCSIYWYKDIFSAVKRWNLRKTYAQMKEFWIFLFQTILLDPWTYIKSLWEFSIRAAPFLFWSPNYINPWLQIPLVLSNILVNAGLYFIWVRPLLYKHQVSPAHWRSWAGATILCGLPTYLRLIQLIDYHEKLKLRLVFE